MEKSICIPQSMLEIQRMKMLLIHNSPKGKVLRQEKNKDHQGQETLIISNFTMILRIILLMWQIIT